MRRAWSCVLVLVVCACGAPLPGEQHDPATHDASVPVVDGGSESQSDAGEPEDAGDTRDAGAPVEDAGEVDAGEVSDDGGGIEPSFDAGETPDAGEALDAGEPDAGQLVDPPDAGTDAIGSLDAGTGSHDAGNGTDPEPGRDGGTSADAGSSVDAGLTPDAGTEPSATLAELWSGAAHFEADPSFAPPPQLVRHAETTTATFGGKHLMYYRAFVGSPERLAIGLAESTDGDRWTAVNRGAPVIDAGGAPGGVDDGGLYAPSVAATPGGLQLVYEAVPGALSGGAQLIAGATSTDSRTWHKLGTIVPGGPGWEAGNVGTPAILLNGSEVVVHYHGFDGRDAPASLARGIARGTSLSSLRKFGPPVLGSVAGTWTEVGPGRADIVKEGEWFYMVFEGLRGSPLCKPSTQTGWGLARSKDLVTWEPWSYNPVLLDTDGGCGQDMPAWQVIGSRHMVVTTRADTAGVRRVKLAKSAAPGTVLGTWEAETALAHQVGRRVGGDWVASAPGDGAGYLAYGPYVTTLPAGTAEARFRIGGSGTGVLGTLEVNDFDESNVRASVPIDSAFLPASGTVEIAVPFLVPPDRHRLEFRVYFRGRGTLRLDSVKVVATRANVRNVPTASPRVAIVTSPSGTGNWVAGSDGNVLGFGDAPRRGSGEASPRTKPVVAMAARPDGSGYWLASSDGGVFSLGDAAFYGSKGGAPLNAPIVGIAATKSGRGYWLAASDGGVFAFGDAAFHGSAGGTPLNEPIVGIAPTPSGGGYWLVASDGGIFTYGDARFHGSTGAIALNEPIVAMAPTPTGNGYRLVASDGGVFTFGDATFHGSTGSIALAAPVVGIAATRTGRGYWLLARDGGVFAFGDAPYLGSAAR